ncbi:M48 family metallopeptidase [Spongiibacter sp. KMU-158]|uniref:Putative beta-barrel assembly-enhancing protease n=1 Tax=Spongiibacter pelagi TaxID=2760804 RepID=A0A927GXW3_9GAMM|nr:M48 family metallopeptidase [Spongiibacter pelagi]
MNFIKPWALSLGLTLASTSASYAQSAAERLPDLGDVTASRFSAQQEFDLGRSWLKTFRAQVKTVDDPFLQDYFESLLYKLAAESELKDRRLETVIVNNPQINAFAVPGGVIGVNSGLFLYSDNEAEFAGVLAHEIAHLSQRHFTRSLDKAKESTLPTLAGLLAGIALAATTGSDAGIAAIAATQAAAQQKQLRFSREHEQEADRVGMETLSKANIDPTGIPNMFENMNAQRRYAGYEPLEFLLTHPLTDSRISDSRNRARSYPRKVYVDNLNFQLAKRRAQLLHSRNPEDLLVSWQDKTDSDVARLYGIAITQIALNKWTEAENTLAPLLKADPHRVAYVLAQAEIETGREDYPAALQRLKNELLLSPHNHPLTMALANTLEKAGFVGEADAVLTEHSQRHSTDPGVWYELAEIRGLAKNILGVHLARAEYFIQVAQFKRARMQLHYAYSLSDGKTIEQARIKQRLRDIDDIENLIKNL